MELARAKQRCAAPAIMCSLSEAELGRAGRDAFCPLHHKGHDRGSRQLTEEKRLAISVDRIRSCPRVQVLLHTEVVALHGDDILGSITLRDNRDRQRVDRENQLALSLPGRIAAHAVGRGSRHHPRRCRISCHRARSDEPRSDEQWQPPGELEARPRSLLYGDEYPRRLCCRRCATRFRQAVRFGGRAKVRRQ